MQPSLRGREPPRSWPIHLAAGWLCAGLASVIYHTSLGSNSSASTLELFADAVDLGRHVAFGLASTVLVAAYRYYVRSPLLGWAAFAGLSLGIGAFCLPTDFEGLVERISEEQGVPADAVLVAVVVLVAGAVPAVAWLTQRRSWRSARLAVPLRALHALVVPLLALSAFWLNVSVSPGSNPSAHLYLSWATAVLTGNALPRLELPWGAAPGRRRALGGVALLGVAWGAWALFGDHRNSVMVQIGRRPSALHLAAVLRSDGGLDTVGATLASRAGPFFMRREGLPAVPPTEPRPKVERPIAIFLSFDSLRADVPAHPEHSKYMPNLTELMRGGATFTNARAPGSMTKYTLMSMSTSRYFSQQYWTPLGRSRWPVKDESVHVAALLSAAGVYTAAFPAAAWMQNERGVLEGFQDSVWIARSLPRKAKWVPGEALTRALLESLERHQADPGFYFVHYLDSHDPFYKAGRRGPKFQRYLATLRIVDGYIGQVRDAVNRLGLEARTLFIISSDHGEAFGEHDSYFHGGTLYDELLRVPLVVAGPSVRAREIDVPVSLVDLGPSLLDWFGAPTPPAFMGESLVPFWLGGRRAFSRPIVAETRLKQAMLFPDGFKVIRDLRRKTLELYDLKRDPGELTNLSDSVDPDHEEHVLLLRNFFQVHTFREHGYRVPYVK